MIERLKFLRDYFNGDLPITRSINSHQVVEILDAVIKEIEQLTKKEANNE